jgi:hypothetical protein
MPPPFFHGTSMSEAARMIVRSKVSGELITVARVP